MKTNDTYNGWKNYETWNIVLWINNDEELYHTFRGLKKYRQAIGEKVDYLTLVLRLGLKCDQTPDGVDYISSELDYAALDEMIAEL